MPSGRDLVVALSDEFRPEAGPKSARRADNVTDVHVRVERFQLFRRDYLRQRSDLDLWALAISWRCSLGRPRFPLTRHILTNGTG